MRVDGKDPFVWNQLNQLIKAQLGCESKVMVFRGLHQAIFETCLALHLKFGHKRRIVAQMGFGDHMRETELELAKLGVRIKDNFEEDMVKEEKANLAYIHDLDDSLTAELYNHIDTLKKVSETKMYRIHVAHHLFHYKKTFIQKLSEYDMIICSLDKYYSLVFCGEKVSLPQLSVRYVPWDLQKDGAEIMKLLKKDNKEMKNEVVKFESSLPQGVEPWFTKMPASRIYDRAMVIFKDIDAHAFMELFQMQSDSELLPP
ncbi:MAG: hypothetical protein HRT44_13380 [Bdellovibrionales bacterium]|nr:hypothetical protein [Bdellovibrionales bacterium]NQZ20230.1 hypothetical protein [Bdellovibrionales bacterium]